VAAAESALAKERERRAQADARVASTRAKATTAREAVAKSEQRREVAARTGDVASVESCTQLITEHLSKAQHAESSASSLEAAATAIDATPLEQERETASNRLLAERCRLAMAKLTAEIPAVAELVRKKLGPLLDDADAAVAACACAGLAPPGLHIVTPGAIVSALHRALVGEGE
jgi:hypothetical protein